MAARLYPAFASDLSAGTIDWTTLTPTVLLLTTDFAYDGAKEYRDELNESFVIAASTAITPKVVGDAYSGEEPFSWLQYSDTKQVAQIVMFDDTGDDAYSRLIAHWDSDSVTGLPFVPNGQNYYLYAVTPPGGYFAISSAELIGMLGSYALAGDYALSEVIGGDTYVLPDLVLSTELDVRDRVCIPASEVESCCTPTFRGTPCA